MRISEDSVIELSNKSKKKIFVICPVRPPKVGLVKKIFHKILNKLFGRIDQWIKNQNAIKAYVERLESNGYEVYWPWRDNPHQKTDKIGIVICEYNRKKLFLASEVHIWYDKNSIGSVFDIGMFFMFIFAKYFKKLVIINYEDVTPTSYKSFENVILTLANEFDNPVSNGLKDRWNGREK